MSRALRCLLSLAGAAGLAACVTPYELPRNVEAAKLNVKAVPAPRICVDGQWKSLTADTGGYAVIPTGQRITLGASYYASGHNVTYRCNPRISFIPLAGSSYYQDFQLEAERCVTRVYREVSTSTNPAGLAFVDSLDRGANCGP